MKLSDVKIALDKVEELIFRLPDGTTVPSHFHVTEIGQTTKKFIDCGGKLRETRRINFQLWSSIDIHHRLQAAKLKDIISLSEERLGLEDLEVEVEYQGADTIGLYRLEFDGTHFQLAGTETDCLAKSACGLPGLKKKITLSQLTPSCCEGPDCC